MYNPVRSRDPTQTPPAASLGSYQLNQPSGMPLPPAWDEAGRRRSSGVGQEMMPPPRGLAMYRVASGEGEGAFCEDVGVMRWSCSDGLICIKAHHKDTFPRITPLLKSPLHPRAPLSPISSLPPQTNHPRPSDNHFRRHSHTRQGGPHSPLTRGNQARPLHGRVRVISTFRRLRFREYRVSRHMRWGGGRCRDGRMVMIGERCR